MKIFLIYQRVETILERRINVQLIKFTFNKIELNFFNYTSKSNAFAIDLIFSLMTMTDI